MSVMRYYAKTKEITFTRNTSWYDFLLGNTKLERRETQLKEWKQKDSFLQLKNQLVSY